MGHTEPEEVQKEFWSRVRIESALWVSVRVYGGWQDCPFESSGGEFGSKHSYASIDCTIDNEESGKSLELPGLIIHLIRDHHFFEGNVKYRLDPREAIEILGIEAGKNYSPLWLNEDLWYLEEVSVDVGSPPEEELLEKLRQVVKCPEQSRYFTDETEVHWQGDILVTVSRREHKLKKHLVIDGAELDELDIPRGMSAWYRRSNRYVMPIE